MNAKNSEKKTIISKSKEISNKKHTQKKNASIVDKKISTAKENQSPQNQEKKSKINTGIILIRKIIDFIKNLKLNLFLQEPLMNSLSHYCDFLVAHLDIGFEIGKSNQINNKFKDPPMYEDSQKSQCIVADKQKGLQRAEYSGDKQNESSKKNMEGSNKIFLPKINKDCSLSKPKQTSLYRMCSLSKPKQTSLYRMNTQQLQKQRNFIQRRKPQSLVNNENINFIKNPKSRFYDLKSKHIQTQSNEQLQSNSELKQNQQSLNYLPKISTSSKSNLSHYEITLLNNFNHQEILQGLKNSLRDHLALVQKLENKIKEFQNKITPKNQINNQSLIEKLNYQQIGANAQSSSQSHLKKTKQQTQILKEQLLQRQSQLRNLYLLLHQNISNPCM